MAWRGTILACLLLACGPMTATGVIDDADVALRRARAQDSDRYAQYETTLAEQYLAKARDLQNHAQYGQARALASEAMRYADAANRKAEHRGGDGSSPSAGLAVPKQ